MNGRLSPPGPYGSGKMRFGPGLGYTKLMQVGLVGCVKKKAGTVRAAGDLYASTLFKDRRRFEERTCRR
jgi:hypothetical protein